MLSRTLLVWVLGLPATVICFVIILLSLLFDRRGNLVHSIGSVWSRLILSLSGVRVTVTGAKNFPRDRPVVILSNHQGAFDIPVLQAFIPAQFRWVAKRSLFKIPLIGWAMGLAGYIAIDRENAASAYKSMEDAAGYIKEGTSVLIFPEGTRSRGGELLPFKKGAFLIAEKSGMDIVPVGIKGTKGIMEKGSLFIRPGGVLLNIGRPFQSKGLEANELRRVSREEIEKLLGSVERQKAAT